MKHLTIALTLALAANVADAKNSLLYRLDINTVSATSYEVVQRPGGGISGIWCAAADHAIKTLGIDRGRIYVERALGPSLTSPGKKGVVFSTRPVPAEASGSSSVRSAGANLRVGHAIQFCRDKTATDR
ncbi:MAG: hypothetical protein ACFB11_16245 [Paracoccaceae bacterium]